LSTAFYQTVLTRDCCYATLKLTRSISCLLTYFFIQHKINNVQFCGDYSSMQVIMPEVLIKVKIRSILFVCWSCKPYDRNMQPGRVTYWDLVSELCLMQSTSCCRWQVKTADESSYSSLSPLSFYLLSKKSCHTQTDPIEEVGFPNWGSECLSNWCLIYSHWN